jgi:hypothetical protein
MSICFRRCHAGLLRRSRENTWVRVVGVGGDVLEAGGWPQCPVRHGHLGQRARAPARRRTESLRSGSLRPAYGQGSPKPRYAIAPEGFHRKLVRGRRGGRADVAGVHFEENPVAHPRRAWRRPGSPPAKATDGPRAARLWVRGCHSSARRRGRPRLRELGPAAWPSCSTGPGMDPSAVASCLDGQAGSASRRSAVLEGRAGPRPSPATRDRRRRTVPRTIHSPARRASTWASGITPRFGR